jgi:chorismate-pyruvate lyase
MTVSRHARRLLSTLLFMLAATAHAGGWPWPGWSDAPATRVKALALLQTLNATLLSSHSATVTLQQWCAAHALAPEARIRARRDSMVRKPADADIRTPLQVGPDETIAYRRVELACGDKVLSEADNWYVPARLTPEMNRTLNQTDTPFGSAVMALGFTRRPLSAELLWSPLPSGWENRMPASAAANGARLDIPERVLRHRAVLYRRDGVPFSLVEETYRRDLFAFPLDPH